MNFDELTVLTQTLKTEKKYFTKTGQQFKSKKIKE